MKHDTYTGDVKALEARNNRLTLQLTLTSAALAISVMALFKMVGSERTVIVPPTINKTFWVTNDGASSEYLEQMGGYAAWLILDVTSASIDWKKQTLLTFMSPESVGAMKIQMELEATRLKKLNASTYFLLQQLSPDEKKQAVMIVGRLRTQINGVDASTVDKSYYVQFEQRGGRIHIKSFKEIENAH